MNGYVTLLGAENVERAGGNISSAADTMTRAASTIDSALDRHAARLEDVAMRQERETDERPTLRDEFAMAALTGILSCFRDHADAQTATTRCMKAYEYADAMLKVRQL